MCLLIVWFVRIYQRNSNGRPLSVSVRILYLSPLFYFMTNENLNSLLNYLNDLGFSDSPLFEQKIEEEASKESVKFQLYTEAFFDEYTKTEARLYLYKSGHPNLYSLERYQSCLLDLKDRSKDRSHTFYVEDGLNVTFKESFNLLEGRSVYKNVFSPNEKFEAWIKLDFDEKDLLGNYKVKRFGLRHGYELEKVLAKYPIRELGDEVKRAELFRSLESGNLQPVIFDKPTKSEKMFIEANPMFKTINIYSLNVMTAKKIGGGPMLS